MISCTWVHFLLKGDCQFLFLLQGVSVRFCLESGPNPMDQCNNACITVSPPWLTLLSCFFSILLSWKKKKLSSPLKETQVRDVVYVPRSGGQHDASGRKALVGGDLLWRRWRWRGPVQRQRKKKKKSQKSKSTGRKKKRRRKDRLGSVAASVVVAARRRPKPRRRRK